MTLRNTGVSLGFGILGLLALGLAGCGASASRDGQDEPGTPAAATSPPATSTPPALSGSTAPSSPSLNAPPPTVAPPATAPGSGLPLAFTAMLRSAVDNRCLIFGGNGNDLHPSRFEWSGGGAYCGMGAKDDLLANKQAVWSFTNVGDDNYVLTNGSAGVDQCLIFGGNGNDTYPTRYNWGDGSSATNCGFGSKEDLLADKQAIFRILRTSATTFQIMNGSPSVEKCLIFGGNGNDLSPSRFNWGSGESSVHCGLPDVDTMVTNKQAVWSIEIL